jgi:hypothetical protein
MAYEIIRSGDTVPHVRLSGVMQMDRPDKACPERSRKAKRVRRKGR